MTAATGQDVELPVVGPYRIVAAIGAGGSARIDLARIDRAYKFQRHVVIKRPLEHLRSDRTVAASLQREARIGGRLRHPNLVAVLDAGTHDGYDYLALEYIHGASLRTLMQTDVAGQVRELPLAVSLGIAIDVARGMHDAHELVDEHGAPLGLVHRDVSPGNVLVGLDGTVKLADFGIAKETRVSTLSGSMHGTVTYMAPEQCRGHAFDRRADVFSLGVILYELVTGARLFWADNDVASLHRVLSGNVTRPKKLRPAIAGELDDLVMTALAHDPDKRFATARELAEAVERYAGSAGLVLGARQLARTMEEVVGPTHAPWVGGHTMVDIPRSDGSLVDIIAAVPDEPADESFGPTDPALESDEPRTPPVRQPHRRSKVQLAVVIGVGLVLGSIATVLVMSSLRGSEAPADVPGSPDLTSPPKITSTPARPASVTPTSVSSTKSGDSQPTTTVDTRTATDRETLPASRSSAASTRDSNQTDARDGESSTSRVVSPPTTAPSVTSATGSTATQPAATRSTATRSTATRSTATRSTATRSTATRSTATGSTATRSTAAPRPTTSGPPAGDPGTTTSPTTGSTATTAPATSGATTTPTAAAPTTTSPTTTSPTTTSPTTTSPTTTSPTTTSPTSTPTTPPTPPKTKPAGDWDEHGPLFPGSHPK